MKSLGGLGMALVLLIGFGLFFIAFLVAPALLIGVALIFLYAFVGRKRSKKPQQEEEEPLDEEAGPRLSAGSARAQLPDGTPVTPTERPRELQP